MEKVTKILITSASDTSWYKNYVGSVVLAKNHGLNFVETLLTGSIIEAKDCHFIPTFTEVAKALEDGKEILVWDKERKVLF